MNVAPFPALRDCLAYLSQMGEIGAVTTELSNRLGYEPKRISEALCTGERRGLVEWFPEPLGRCNNRRRWYAAGMRPAVKLPVVVQTKPAPEPNGVRAFVDPRFHVELPAGYRSALSSSECRPWARALGA